MIKEALRRLKEGTEHLNYGREIVVDMSRGRIRELSRPARVLDVGFGSAVDLLNIRRGNPGSVVLLYGVDGHEATVAQGAALGVHAAVVDIESERLPFEDAFFDVVVANQVIEHTKEIFWIFSEISRVTRPGGCVIVGFPNLASLHSRVLLLAGEQPSSINLLGPHVRGISHRSFETFVTTDGYFRVREVRGANFYPFPPAAARFLSRAFPTLAVCLVVRLERTEKPGTFIDVLKTRFFETNFRISARDS